MPVVPINADFSNIAQFINSLFSPDVRSLSSLQQAISSGLFSVPFSSEGDKILGCWMAAWQSAQGLPFDATALSHCPVPDQQLMRFLSGYIGANGLSMFVPQLSPAGLSSGGPPIYELRSYTRVDFQPGPTWDEAAVRQFLNLFMLGAHFVAIDDPQDVPAGCQVTDLYTAFQDGILKGSIRDDPGNSHYTSLTSLLGRYFPDINSEQAEAPSPFTCACLVGPTIQNSNPAKAGDTFLQLEGWPETTHLGIPNPNGRHMADYATYNATLWNISTFGACAYSEKRATAIFLAPPTWKAQVTPGTFMPPYAGAYSPQGWLQTSLVRLPG